MLSLKAGPTVSPKSQRHVVKLSQRPARGPRCAAGTSGAYSLSQDYKHGRAFVFGLGYTGLAVASYLKQAGGWGIAGTCRSEEKQAALQTAGIDAFCMDPDNLQGLRIFFKKPEMDGKAATHIVTTVPPNGDFNQDPVLQAHAKELGTMGNRLQWAGYISSTGVYGDWQGDWVDESSAIRGTSQTAKARIEAEAAWTALREQTGFPVHIFRLGGIYGPGRSALDAAKAKGDMSENQARRSLRRYTSRCHVHDVCRVLYASMQHPDPGSIYNIVDDDPASRTEVMAYARGLLSGGEPARIPLDVASEMSPQPPLQDFRAVDQKRVRNAKIKQAFGLNLEYPTYREGLEAIHAGCKLPFQFQA